jgi:transcriptional regulator with XRE-family HTH domain
MSAIEDNPASELVRRRHERGWSLNDLSDRTGLSRAYLSAIERGRTKRPGAETLRRLEAAVGPADKVPPIPSEAPPGLAQVAEDFNLTSADVATLASLRIRGRQPRSKERWSFIYQAMLTSESLDEVESVYRKRASNARPTLTAPSQDT